MIHRALFRARVCAKVRSFPSNDGTGAFAELTLRDVNLGGAADGGGTVDGVELPVVGSILDVDVALDVRAAGGWEVVRVLAVLAGVDVNVYALTAIVLLGLVGVDVSVYALTAIVLLGLVGADVNINALTAVILLRLACALVNVDLFAVLRLLTRRRAAGCFEDLDVFGVGFAALSRLDVEGEVFVVFLPPCLWSLCLCFYLDTCRFLLNVLGDVPVARWED